MNINKFLLFILLLLLIIDIKAQDNKPLPEVSPSDIPGGEIVKKDYYDAKTLWGYIDGGADIYLEYGLDKVVVEEINWQKEHFKVEVYRMLNPQAAFGIYSVSKANCSSQDSLSEYSCITTYQTVLFKSNFYISVINDTGSDEAKQLSNKISGILINKINKGDFRLPGLFELNQFSKYKREIKFFNGILGLQNSLPELADQFENFRKYQIYFLPVEMNNGSLNLFIINFSEESDASKFCSKNTDAQKANGLYKNIIKLNPNSIIYLESNLTSDINSTYDNIINDYIKQQK